jgi:hypothetical protein
MSISQPDDHAPADARHARKLSALDHDVDRLPGLAMVPLQFFPQGGYRRLDGREELADPCRLLLPQVLHSASIRAEPLLPAGQQFPASFTLGRRSRTTAF